MAASVIMASFLCGLLMLTSIVLVESESKDAAIAQDIITETKRAGDTGKLNCTVTNKGDSDSVLWTKLPKGSHPSKLIFRDESIQIMVEKINGVPKYELLRLVEGSKNTEIYMLVVHRLKESDDGMYECKISKKGYPDSESPKREGRLYVQTPPIIDKGRTEAVVFAQSGHPASLTCAAKGRPEPKIMWTRIGDNYLKNPSGEYIPRFYGENYTIINVDANDRGLYRCMADNNVRPPAIYDVTLNVKYPPTVAAFRKYVGQAADKNWHVELNCRVTGYPDPKMGWYKIRENGDISSVIQDSHKYDVEVINSRGPYLAVGENWMILRIRTLSMGDYGNYSCQADNQYGSAKDTINLFLTRTCQGPDCYNWENTSGSSCLQVSLGTLILTAVVASFFTRR